MKWKIILSGIGCLAIMTLAYVGFSADGIFNRIQYPPTVTAVTQANTTTNVGVSLFPTCPDSLRASGNLSGNIFRSLQEATMQPTGSPVLPGNRLVKSLPSSLVFRSRMKSLALATDDSCYIVIAGYYGGTAVPVDSSGLINTRTAGADIKLISSYVPISVVFSTPTPCFYDSMIVILARGGAGTCSTAVDNASIELLYNW